MKKTLSHPYLKNKEAIKTTLILFLALFLFLIPLKFGVGENDNIPIVGGIEKMSQEEVDNTLQRAGSAYATLKAIQITPKIFENVEVPFVKMRIGALLSPIVEQLDMLDSVLFYALLVAFGEKFLLGWITYVALHWMIPIGLLLYALGKISFIQRNFAMVGRVGVFAIQFGVLAYLLLPITAYINQSIYSAYNIDNKIELIQNQEKQIKQYEKELGKAQKKEEEKKVTPKIEQEVSIQEEEEFAREISQPKEEKGFFASLWDSAKDMASDVGDGTKKAYEKTKEVASDIADGAKKIAGSTFEALTNPKETIDKICKTLNDVLNSFMEMVAVFVITTIVVPIGVFFGFVAIFKQIYNLQIKGVVFEVQESIQNPLQRIKSIKEKIHQGRNDE